MRSRDQSAGWFAAVLLLAALSTAGYFAWPYVDAWLWPKPQVFACPVIF